MGGTALFIDLGTVGDPDDPHCRASIDPDCPPYVWHFDVGDIDLCVRAP